MLFEGYFPGETLQCGWNVSFRQNPAGRLKRTYMPYNLCAPCALCINRYLPYTPPYTQYAPNFARKMTQSLHSTSHQQYSHHKYHVQQLQLSNNPAVYNAAYAVMEAGPDYPEIKGLVTFTEVPDGVLVCADISGLPPYRAATDDKGPIGPFGFHIHEIGPCEIGSPENPFEACGGHWNPTNQPHGNHAGDFPVLVADNGRARMCFITSRFSVKDILGRCVIIHENPDDYRTQPSGNSGKRIACGTIRPWNAL